MTTSSPDHPAPRRSPMARAPRVRPADRPDDEDLEATRATNRDGRRYAKRAR